MKTKATDRKRLRTWEVVIEINKRVYTLTYHCISRADEIPIQMQNDVALMKASPLLLEAAKVGLIATKTAEQLQGAELFLGKPTEGGKKFKEIITFAIQVAS